MATKQNFIDPPPDGREAEELRRGIEGVIANMHSGEFGANDAISMLQDLLEEVDARDSLSFKESRWEDASRVARLHTAVVQILAGYAANPAFAERFDPTIQSRFLDFQHQVTKGLIDWVEAIDQAIESKLQIARETPTHELPIPSVPNTEAEGAQASQIPVRENRVWVEKGKKVDR